MLTYRPSALHPCLDNVARVLQDNTVYAAVLTHLTEKQLQGAACLISAVRLEKLDLILQFEIYH